jgi:hypothetical protein
MKPKEKDSYCEPVLSNPHYTIFTRIKDDPAYKTTPPPFTIFNFQENTNIRVSQVFMSLIVCIFNILELNNHLS